MYTGEILRIGEKHRDERVNLGRKNLGLEDQDVICVARFGYVSRFDTLLSVCMQFNRQFSTIEEAMQALLDSLNKPETSYEDYYNAMQAEIGGNG